MPFFALFLSPAKCPWKFPCFWWFFIIAVLTVAPCIVRDIYLFPPFPTAKSNALCPVFPHRYAHSKLWLVYKRSLPGGLSKMAAGKFFVFKNTSRELMRSSIQSFLEISAYFKFSIIVNRYISIYKYIFTFLRLLKIVAFILFSKRWIGQWYIYVQCMMITITCVSLFKLQRRNFIN